MTTISYLIIETNNNSAYNRLDKWVRGERRKELEDKFLSHLGGGTFVAKATEDVLALVWALKLRYEEDHYYVDIYAAELLNEAMIPSEIKSVAKELKKKPTAKNVLKNVDAHHELDVSELYL